MAKLASGRVGAQSSELLDLFNASLSFDQKLYQEDIAGSWHMQVCWQRRVYYLKMSYLLS